MPDAVKAVGRYEILRELGRGGMATVHLARQRDLDRLVALKELAAFHAADPSFAQRFVRESRVAGSLSHPNIVTVHDYFEHDGTPYIAMEYAEGGSLRPWVGRMSLAQMSGVLEGVLAGLTSAEAQGIVHRDLKPENVMVTSDGQVKIADFGIAKASTDLHTGAFRTATGVTVGTPNYMAPEQAMGRDVGPWTDLYSIGCMAFELFTGRVPFHDTDAPMAILMRHVNDEIPPVRAIDPSIDEEISDWIQGLLAKDPATRTSPAAEAWDAYEEIADRLLPRRWRREAPLTGPAAAGRRPAPPPPFTPPPADLPPEPLADAPPLEPPSSEPAAAPPDEAHDLPTTPIAPDQRGGRRRRPAVIAAAALLVAVAAAVVVLSGGGGDADGDGRGGGGGGGGGTKPTVVDVPDRPNGLALSDGIVWVSTRAGTVGIRDDRTLIERGSETTQGGRTIAERGDTLWIPIPDRNEVAQLDARTGAPLDPTITTAGRPKAIAFGGGAVLVSETDGTTTWVQRYGAATGAPVDVRVTVPDGVQRIAERGGVLWVLSQQPDALLRYDADTGVQLGSTPVGAGAAAMTVAGGSIWVTGAEDGSLTRVDEKTQETERFELGGSPQNVRAGLGAIWVTNATKAALQRLDPATGDIRDIPVGRRPFSLVADRDGIWVGDTAQNKVRLVKP